MEKLIPKELAKNNKQTINNPRMENKSEDTPRTKISRFKQSFKASQRILKSKPVLEKVESKTTKFPKLTQQDKMPLRQFLSQRKWPATHENSIK